MRIALLILCYLGFAGIVQAQPLKKNRPGGLFFPADKNNLQVLPQRFEYSLLTENTLKIGDILIDTTKVTFRLEPTTNSSPPYRAHFTWPAGLINEGEIAIKSNSGIAVLTSNVTPETTKVGANNSVVDENSLPERSQLASYSIDIPSNLYERMKFFPFMTFCIYRESQETRLYLCSRELFLGPKADAVIRPRVQSKRTSHVTINGKTVGNQGLIYLNKSEENVAFSAYTQTGAFLEIETRRQDVDFKDVTVSEDGKRVSLVAAGAQPVNENNVRRLPQDAWETSLPMQRPVLFLKGDGDIPMRQEFNIRGELPKEKYRPTLTSASSYQTYSSDVTLKGTTPPGVRLETQTGDKDPQLQFEDNHFTWTLNNLTSNEKKRRYLTAKVDGREMTLAYDIFRGSPFSATIGVSYLTPSNIVTADLELQWWIEKFLGLNTEVTHLHWGLGLERKQVLVEKKDYGKVEMTTVELLWRASSGLNFIDNRWGLSLPIQMVQGDKDSAMIFGLGAFWLKKPELKFLKKFMHWSELKMHYFSGSSGDTFKVSRAYNLEANAYKNLSESFYLKYGLGLSQYKFEPAPLKTDMQITLSAAASWVF